MKNKKIAISYSGGKDSTAMLLLAMEMQVDFVAVYQDTGFEHPEHYEYLDYISKALGIEIIKNKSKKYDGMFDLIDKTKALPNGRMRFCTEELKQKPFADWLKTQDINEVWIGVRKDESASRMKRNADKTFDTTFPIWEYNSFSKKQFKNVVVRLPIIEWTVEDVWEMHKKNYIEPNPMYKKGFKRVGCFPCVCSGKSNWINTYKDYHGKKNIEKLIDSELMVQEYRQEKNYTFLMNHVPLTELIKEIENMDKQIDLFDHQDQPEIFRCSWCSD